MYQEIEPSPNQPKSYRQLEMVGSTIENHPITPSRVKASLIGLTIYFFMGLAQLDQ